MEPTVADGSLMVAARSKALVGDYRKGDVALVDLTCVEKETPVVKRIAGLPGDSIAEYEPFFAPSIRSHLKVPEGHVYVVGDNASDSLDSRYFGYLHLEDLQGKCMGPLEFLALPLVAPPTVLAIAGSALFVWLRRPGGRFFSGR